MGLVVERDRSPEEIDGLRWYVGDSDKILYEEYFHCTDLGVQLVPVIERFMSSEMYRSGQPNPDAKATYDVRSRLASLSWLTAPARSSPSTTKLFFARPYPCARGWTRTPPKQPCLRASSW